MTMTTLTRRSDDQIISKIVKFWPLVAAIVGIIVTIYLTKDRVENHEVRIVQVEKDVKDLQVIKANTELLVDYIIKGRRGRRTGTD